MMKKKVIVLGAGISGLSLAWFLRKRFGNALEITILEKSSRAGGWIQTIKKGGFLFEQGPRSCRSRGSGISTLQLIEDLGLEEHVITESPAARKRYLYESQRLRLLPSSCLSLLASPYLPMVIRGLWKDLRASKSNLEDESVYDFVLRRLGKEVAEQIIDPFVRGIYAGDIRGLSVKSAFPTLYNLEKNHGSLIKGMVLTKRKVEEKQSPFIQTIRKRAIFTLRDGLEMITTALAHKFSKELKFESAAEKLHLDHNGVEIETCDGSAVQADYLFSALPPRELGKLLARQDQSLSQRLGNIETASLAIVGLGYHSKVLSHEGFGYLVPSKENEKILGVVFDSSAFPQQNACPEETRLTVMMGGIQVKNFNQHSTNDFLETALKSIAKHLDIHRKPDTWTVKLAPNAIPQYQIGHKCLIETMEKKLPLLSRRVAFIGNGFYGISMNDCIAHSKALSSAWNPF